MRLKRPVRAASVRAMSAAAQIPKIEGKPVASRPSPYFVGLNVDLLLVGGLSLLTFFILRKWSDGARTETVWTLAGYLVWVVNWPHFAATSYRLYGSRAHLRQYPVTAAVTPFVVLAGVIGSFAAPLAVAPYFVKLFLIWSPYHFSGQTIGVSLLYARRAGYALGSLERLCLVGFVYATFLVGTVRAEVGLATGHFYDVAFPTFGLPMMTATVVEIGMWIFGGAFALIVLGKAVKASRLPPIMFLVPSITQYVWFVAGRSLPNYVEFVPLFHSLQYLLIAWSMQLKEKADRSGVRADGAYVLKESARWYVLNVVGGAILFSFLPFVATKLGVSNGFATAVIICGVQIHHFFVDGVIWKLRSSSVVSPLLVNVPEMVRQAERQAA